MDPQPQPPGNEDAPAFFPTPAANLAPEDNPAMVTAEDRAAPEDGGLLEFPLQDRHHRIISAFMAEHRRDSSPDGPGRSGPLPGPPLQELAARLRSWWAQRKAPMAKR